MVTASELTRGRLLAKNSVINFAGQVLPLAIGVLVIPSLVRGLGVERFGVLALSWSLIGYSSLFDLGIGRALTKLIAEKLGTGESSEIPSLICTGLVLMFIFGVLGGFVIALVTPLIGHYVLKASPELQPEIVSSFYWIAGSLPIVIVTAGLRGVLEAKQLFVAVNAVRIPVGVLTFLGPWVVLFFSHSLVALVAALSIVRVLAAGAQLGFVLHYTPELSEVGGIRRSAIKPLFNFGAWMTVSNIIGPLMVNLDRFLIGAVVSMAAVTYYATPYEVVTKLWIVPMALVGVLFPAFSSISGASTKAIFLLERSVTYVILMLFVPSFALVAFAHGIMQIWLGPAFAANSTVVLQLLAIGVFVNSVALVAFTLIQGLGRPDLTAKLHLAELPIYCFALWSLLHLYGVKGAAVAWMLRAIVDAAAMFVLVQRLLPTALPVITCIGIHVTVAMFILLASVSVPAPFKSISVAAVVLIYGWWSWRSALGERERGFIIHRLRLG